MPPTETTSGDLVSIIITCFNQGHYLESAIESALAQTVSRSEIIIVNDGSTDSTADVARSYPQVKYIYQSNSGISAARNSGIRASTGDFALFLDADDRLLPNATKAGLLCLRRYPDSGFVFGRYHKINEIGAVISPPNQFQAQCDFYAEFLQSNRIGMQSTVMYPREVLKCTGGFDEALPCCEDYDLYLRIAREFPVHKHDEIVAEYRRHGQNMSQNYRFMLDTIVQVLNAQVPYASCNPRYTQALNIGLTNWRNYYGSLMLQDLTNNLSEHGLGRVSMRRFRTVASAYPQGIGAATKEVLRRMIQGPRKSGLSL